MRPERGTWGFCHFSCPDNDVALSPSEPSGLRSSTSCCVTPAQSPGHSCGVNSLPNVIITRAQRHSERPQGFLFSLQGFLKPAVLGACPPRRGSWGWASEVLPYSWSPPGTWRTEAVFGKEELITVPEASLFSAPPWASTLHSLPDAGGSQAAAAR